jgi:hypothetical protein
MSRSPNTSNAPAGTPHASPNREFGRDRAAEVGRGEQRGLEKDSVRQNTGKAKKNKKKSARTRSAATTATGETEKR